MFLVILQCQSSRLLYTASIPKPSPRLNAICNATTGRQGSRNAKTTASSRVGQSPDPPHYRTRKAHLQHPQEDSCNQGCNDNQDYTRTRLFDELTRPRHVRSPARRLARAKLEVVLALSMLFSKFPISPAPVRANRREYTKTAHAPQCDLRCNYGAEKFPLRPPM